MKQPNELKDDEMNEWLAVNVMGWKLEIHESRVWGGKQEDEIWVKPECDGELVMLKEEWNPTTDLNSAFMMQEKIDDDYNDYVENLGRVIGKPLNDLSYRDFAFASARQRCNAAYLTLVKKHL